VERPGGDPTREFPGFHEALARGKRSAVLDLSDPRGRAAFLTLAAGADVLLEGYRPGAMSRPGLGHEVLREANSALVHVCVSGFGQDGPYRDRLSYQALAGTLYGQLGQGGAAPPDDAGTG
jgi:crotonobetainyl-CoA:carnitine CoA-transferase CaiB-like acyl-CoA transferase